MPPLDRERQTSLIVGSELRELSRVSAWVHAWGEHQRLGQRVIHNLDLCSTELVTNIVTHGCGDGGGQSIRLRLGWQGEDVSLDVEDDGSPFDPLRVPEPTDDLQDGRVGGWGLPIVRHFCDDMHYRREDGRNCLTLLFRPTAPP